MSSHVWRKHFGQFVDALAWRGMHAIARRQELHLTAQMPAMNFTTQPNVKLMFPAPEEDGMRSFRIGAWQKHSGMWQCEATFSSPLPSPHARNNVVYVRAHAPERALHLPAVIVLHGLMNFTTAAYAPFLRAIVDAGASAYILELPYHHRRTPRGSLSGDLFHTIDLNMTQHAVQQAVAEVRLLMRYLRDAGASHLGVLGFSLGAWIGGLVACCDTQLDFAMLGMPPSHLNELVWRTALGAQLARHFAKLGWSSENTAAFYAALDPLTYQPLLPRERIQFYAAEFDTLIALEKVQALRRAWGGAEVRAYPHGHLTIMLSRQLHRDFRADFARQIALPRREE